MRLPLIRALMVFTLILAVPLLSHNARYWRRKLWPPAAIGAWIAALIVSFAIVPAVSESRPDR